MATNTTKNDSLCSLCQQPADLRFGSCQHDLCLTCLHNFCEEAKWEGNALSCPKCSIQSSSPAKDSAAHYIQSMVDDVKELLTKQEVILQNSTSLKEKLMQLITEAKNKRDMLEKSIDEQADKIIRVVKDWKYETNRQLQVKFKVISEAERSLRDYSTAVENLSKQVLETSESLSKVKLDIGYGFKLLQLKHVLHDLEVPEDEGINGYSGQLQSVLGNDYIFQPEWVLSFGKIVSRKEPKSYKYMKIFQHTLQECPEESSVRHVTTLNRKHYAVALSKDATAFTVCILDMQFNTLKHKFDVQNILRMTATPQGNLTIARKSGSSSEISINVYDGKTGLECSCLKIDLEFSYLYDMAVTKLNQLITLNREWTSGVLNVFGEDGSKQHRYTIEHSTPRRLAYGGHCIFVTGDYQVNVYTLLRKGIILLTTITTDFNEDIAATPVDDVILQCRSSNRKDISLAVFQQEEKDVWEEKCRIKCNEPCDAFDTLDGRRIVIGHNQTIDFLETHY